MIPSSTQQTAKLVAITQPVNLECKTAEDFVAYAARVSNPANQNNFETADKLVRYLIREKHWSPFEMVSMTIEIQTTRDIGRQIIRHRSFSYQEFSQRYAEIIGTFVTRQARLQDHKNRQNSIITNDDKLNHRWGLVQKVVAKVNGWAYNWALKNGIAKEQARVVLPEGMTQTTMYMAGTLRSWIHYCALRADKGTQLEHREIADKVIEIIFEHFPSIYTAAFEPYDDVMSRGEMTPDDARAALQLDPIEVTVK